MSFTAQGKKRKEKNAEKAGGNLGTVHLCDRHPKGEERKTFRKFCTTTAQLQDHPSAGKK